MIRRLKVICLALLVPGLANAADSTPYSFKVGDALFKIGGFMDFTTVFRTVNTGNSIGTNFGSIPYRNTVAGNLTETRMSAQNSRLSLKATDKFGENDVTGYMEMDFLGNDPANAFVTSNSHTARLRLYWLDLMNNKWEMLAGQSWSWLTPNRRGISGTPSDLFITNNVDTNYQVGLTFTRAAQFRVAYHPNDNWAYGVALENPEQFVGTGEVIFPFALNAQLGVQYDASNNSSTPNVFPDVIPKITYDTEVNDKHFHVEAVGLITTVKDAFILPGSTDFATRTKTGAGISLNTVLEVVKNFRMIATSFYSDGGGRYLEGLGPDTVVLPDGTPSLVHSGGGILGFEAQVNPKNTVAAYYGGAYFAQNSFQDTTNPLPTAFAGFGGPNSPNSANRIIQELTADWTHSIWKSPDHGAVQVMTQLSYLTRTPWFVPQGAPANAHLTMAFVNLRYVLP